jgi:hypothetical protein
MFELSLWAEKLMKWPTWPCPTCFSVALAIDRRSLAKEETGPSKRARQRVEWEPDWIEQRFSALLRCRNPACGEIVAVAGSVQTGEKVLEDETGQLQQSFGDLYVPAIFDPPLPIFHIPRDCPETVRAQLQAAFALIWSDVASAANRLRVGAECLLDEQGVRKTTKNSKGKRVQLTLDSRIEIFRKTKPEAAGHLMAIKWIGNVASHRTLQPLTRGDALNGFMLFEAAIDVLYVKRAEKIRKLTEAITKRKGRPKATRKRRRRSP